MPVDVIKVASEMTLAHTQAATTTPQSTGEKKLKPCCACPETKKARDACIIENGEEKCQSYIEAHKDCMRKMGFNV